MRLSITCCTQEGRMPFPAAPNEGLPMICCAAGCKKHSVYKLTGRVPPKTVYDLDWFCFEIGLTLCEDHEQTDIAESLVGLPDVRRHLRNIARSMGVKPDMRAIEIEMIPFAVGTA